MAGKKKQDDKESSSNQLRTEAEKKVARSADKSALLKKQDLDKLVHELQVHQVELEMQNEELRTARGQLEESRNDYVDLYDFAPVGYLTFNGDALITGVNLTGAALLGVERQKLLKRRFRQFVAPADAERWDRHFVSVLQQGEKQSCDLLLRRRDGSTLHARLDSIRVEMDDGTGVVRTVMSDVTERKRAEEMIRHSEEKHRTLFETMAQGLVYQNAEGYIFSANHAAEQILGLTLDQMQGITSTDPRWKAIHEDGSDYPGDTHPAMVAVKTGKEVRNMIMGVFHPANNEYVWININAIPQFKPGESKPYQVYTTFEDITERKRLEKEQQRVDKLGSIGILAGGIAHDFNNILTAILGNISLAKMETKPESELHDSLEDAEKASLRAKDLTQQLLTFSKGGSPVKKLASLSELLKDTASFALRGSNVKYQFSIPDDLWHAEIDEGQISQVINNLVINSQQAMPTGGTIEVRAENMALTEKQSLGRSLPLKKGKYIRIAVTDHGTGIPEEHLEKIFDPFFTTKQKGSGLGLATSFSIIRNHGGHISVESKVGTGSTFYVYLPASTKTATTRKTEEKQTIPVGKARILVMDDEEMVREVAGRMLKHIGYEDIEFAADGAEAIKLYSEALKGSKPFDLVILDLTIPGGMGGKETIQKLREIDPQVKAIVSSGYSNESAIADYKEYGFKGMVAKPYTLDQLRKALHELIG